MAGEPTGDDRIIGDSGIDARVAAIVSPVLETMGYRLVRVRLTSQNGMTLQIMAERPDGSMTVEDCEEVSRGLSPVLDVEDPIDKAYHLEVSSPGIDRPLVRKSDFEDGLGHLVKIETSIMIEGRKRFHGRLTEAGDADVLVERDLPSHGEASAARIPYDAIAEARLVLTDDLVRDALKKDKKLRQENKRRGRSDDYAGETEDGVADE